MEKIEEKTESVQEREDDTQNIFSEAHREEKKRIEKEKKSVFQNNKFLPGLLYKKFEDKREATLKNLSNGVCQEHDRQLELICMKEKVRICADCGLFGKHKNHSLLPFRTAVKEEESALSMILSSVLRLKTEISDVYDQNDLPSNFNLMMLQTCTDKKKELLEINKLKFQVKKKVTFRN
jgi:hypothetical protein